MLFLGCYGRRTDTEPGLQSGQVSRKCPQQVGDDKPQLRECEASARIFLQPLETVSPGPAPSSKGERAALEVPKPNLIENAAIKAVGQLLEDSNIIRIIAAP